MVGSWTVQDAARVLRRPTAADDKYSRGVLGVRTGSDAYPGAAVLGVEAAWRTGLGMVRYLGPSVPTSLVLQRCPETVTVDGRVQAWLIGSGTDASARTDADTDALRTVLSSPEPVVVDAGALDLAPDASAPIIVTPHAREHARLRSILGLAEVAPGADAERAASAVETAAALGGTVVLKGSVTIVAAANGWVTSVSAGTPWLATAGTGDVLAGAIGAVVAGAGAGAAGDLGRLAAAGVWLHGRAGALAAAEFGPAGGPLTASDVAAALPRAVAEALATR
ncbi:yjeF C-terminal region, hydroxyethylthiazole kinase-related [Microbacterium sp. cf046]|uniref:ADP-dependent NAD(P)H-hydrate dehydratase n=1 Tax=Microbacterium sp. cf046 TaxID=1761803 RepID=UPI0008E007A7|nr:ADP/ATP-dependent (S)-NAD(P)H-hydrate dehydratase [Microbacterium sp. cf046]SFR99778.1 yjeF C-terminal region, hydroxyethylthiazole kinase-related [Microbacterium sp. cf046]